MRDVVVDGSALTIDDVVAVAHGQARVRLGDDVPKRMEVSRSVVVEALRGDAPVYGVNTGFGALADTPVGEADLTTLQGAIVRSHAAATGAPLDDETVRAILLLRARTLAAGYSGVRADLPARLLELLYLDLLPVIPGKGSVGRLGRPGPARAPGPAADRGGAAARARRSRGRAPGRRGAGRARDRAADARPQGGPVAGQRHRADAGAARLLGPRRRDARAGGRRGLRALDRGAARHRPALRRAGPGDQAASGPAGQRGQPARAAGRVAAAGQPPAQPARGAGRLLPALRAAGARRGQGRAHLRPPGPRPPSWARWWTTRSSCPTARS